FDRVKLRFAIRVVKALFKQTRRSGVIFGGTGPEDTVVLLDFFPRYAIVIGIAASRSDSQLVENISRRIEVEILLSTHPSRNLLDNPPVNSRFARWIVGFINLYNAAFAITRDAFIFAPSRTG